MPCGVRPRDTPIVRSLEILISFEPRSPSGPPVCSLSKSSSCTPVMNAQHAAILVRPVENGWPSRKFCFWAYADAELADDAEDVLVDRPRGHAELVVRNAAWCDMRRGERDASVAANGGPPGATLPPITKLGRLAGGERLPRRDTTGGVPTAPKGPPIELPDRRPGPGGATGGVTYRRLAWADAQFIRSAVPSSGPKKRISGLPYKSTMR